MLKLTKDPTHAGYYTDDKGNLYVFRFGGRPIKVDSYRDDKPNEGNKGVEIEVNEDRVIDGTEDTQREYKIRGTEDAIHDYSEKQNISYDQAETLLNINGDDYTTDNKTRNISDALNDWNKKGGIGDTFRKANLNEKYQQTIGVSDDWYTEEGRKIGMSDEEIAKNIYNRKGAEAQGSSDNNIKRLIAGMEKQKWEDKVAKTEAIINDPNESDIQKSFAKSQLQGEKNKVEEFANYEAEFIKRLKHDDEEYIVKYRDTDFVDNFSAQGLDEAFELKDQWLNYSDDVHIYDNQGREILQDKDVRNITSPKYEENKRKNMIANFRNNLYGADRASLISMLSRLGYNYNFGKYTDAQLYNILKKNLDRENK